VQKWAILDPLYQTRVTSLASITTLLSVDGFKKLYFLQIPIVLSVRMQQKPVNNLDSLNPYNTMNLRLTIMLILIMAIMPVAVAFAHYSELASQLSTSQIVVAADVSDESISPSPHSDHCQSATAKPHLASCSFHVCIDCAITSSFRFIPIQASNDYGYGEKPNSASFLVPPDIKPPIFSL
jgi:hypothetical protein